MKKNVITAMLIAGTVLLAGCSGSVGTGSSSEVSTASSGAEETAKTAAEKAESLMSSVTFAGEMVAVSADSLELRLGFTSDGITDYAAYICGSGAYPDEFGVFTAESTEKADEIKAALEKRIETQRATYQDYTPDEMYKFDDCFVKQDGSLVYYAVTADNATAAEILG